MDFIPQQAGLYTQHATFLFHSSVFMFFVSYLYGYGISFIFGTKKTFAISLFIVVITAILILFFTATYVFWLQCFSQPNSHCFGLDTGIQAFLSWTMIFMTNFLLNILIGVGGVVFGIVIYFPSEIVLAKYFGITLHEESIIHLENYSPTYAQAVSSGVNTFLEKNRQTPVPPPPVQSPPPPAIPTT